MSQPTPFEFFHALYPEPVQPGQLAVHTRTRRGGKLQISWCCSLHEAARLIRRVRNTRTIGFGVALHDPLRALAIARCRRRHAARGSVRGTADTATALSALWAKIAISSRLERPAAMAPAGMPELPEIAGVPNRATAVGLLGAVPEAPSIVLSNRQRLLALWRLDELWTLDTPGERARAADLLRRLQWAIQQRAQDSGWQVPASADLAQVLPVPQTLSDAPEAGRLSIERFPLSDGEGRVSRRAFEALPQPPEAPSLHVALTTSAPTPDLEPPVALAPVWHGCGFLREAHAQSASLPHAQYLDAVSILARCAAPGFSGRELAHHLGRPHPGYTAAATDDHTARTLRDPRGPSTCRQILAHCRSAAEEAAAECFESAEEAGDASAASTPRPEIAGVSPEPCQRCPHRGRLGSPLDLGAPSLPPASPAVAALPSSSSAAGAGRPEPAPRRKEEIVITADLCDVNDRALAALAAGHAGLFEHGGQMVTVHPPRGSSGAAGAPPWPVINPVTEARLHELLSQHCTFLRKLAPRSAATLDHPRPAQPRQLARAAAAG
ncbi:MAG: hypothetical protein AAF560_17930 [Acidobacteriota bacterium]